DDDRRRPADRGVLTAVEGPSDGRVDAEHLEVIPRDDAPAWRQRLVTGWSDGDVQSAGVSRRDETGDQHVAVAQIAIQWVRAEVGSWRALRPRADARRVVGRDRLLRVSPRDTAQDPAV